MMYRTVTIFAMITCIGLLSGCASVPKEAGFPDVQRLIEQRIGQRVHWNQGRPEDAAVSDAVQIALLNNRSLQATYEELGIAQADLVQAGLLRNPTFFASFRFMDRAIDRHRQTNTEFSVDQDFLDLLMLPLRKKVAAAQFEQAKQRVSNAVLDLAKEVRSAYYTLQSDEQILEMRRTVAQATEAAAELASRQLEAGTLKQLDVDNQKGFYHQAKLDMARTEIQVVTESLRRLIMITRRKMLFSGAAALLTGGISMLLGRKQLKAIGTQTTTQPSPIAPPTHGLSYTPVVTPNGSTLPWKWDNGVKVFHLIAEPVKREFAPGMIVNCWGYNGQTP
ncbi:MAG: TolC family protein, partial [Candidatus Brocadia sp.]